jgi:hypothetical protein
MLIYFMTIWNTLMAFGKFYDHLAHFVLIWYIFSGFGTAYQEKSGNPALEAENLASRSFAKFCHVHTHVCFCAVDVPSLTKCVYIHMPLAVDINVKIDF